MKHMKKIIAVLILVALVYTSQSLYSSEIVVEDINVQNQNQVDIVLNTNPNLSVWVQDTIELVILEDVSHLWWLLNTHSSKQVELKLNNPLKPLTQYSLLTLSGTEWSIDFKTPAGVEWYKVSNFMSMKSDDIDSIEILDDTTLLIEYRQNLTNLSYDYKLFAELDLAEIRKDDFQLPIISIETSSPLSSETDYLVMLIDMRDVNWNTLQLDTGIYNFMTPVFDVADIQVSDIDTNVYLDDSLSDEDIRDIEESIIETHVPLEAAPEIEEGNIEEIAAQASELDPEAWAATGILILFALLFNAFFFRVKLKRFIRL